MSSSEIRRLTPLECDDLTASLGDTPETVIAVHQLRHGQCEAYVQAGSDRNDAVILRPSRPSAVSERYADLSVVTADRWRGRGLATACAGLVAAVIQRSGRVPVWSTGEDNVASLRVARKLGFEEVGRRTYLIVGGDDPQ